MRTRLSQIGNSFVVTCRGRMKKLKIMTVILGLLGSIQASAHPVSYQGATSLMIWNQSFLNDFWLTYSFHADKAIALRAMRMVMPEGEMALAMPQFDYLVKRWNGSDYQANFYVYGGVGGARFQKNNSFAGMSGFEADIESRRLYLSGYGQGLYTTAGNRVFMTQVKTGVAPYLADFEDLATWIMFNVQYQPQLTKPLVFTPLVRLFYKNFLVEGGYSFTRDWMFNFMIHF